MAILWFLSRIPHSGSSSHPPPPSLPFVVPASRPDSHSIEDREESKASCHQLLACSSSLPPNHSYLHSASLPSPSLIMASSLFNRLSPLSLLTHKVLLSGKLRSLPFLTVFCALAVPLTKGSPFLGTHYFLCLQGHSSILCLENP